MRRGLDGLLCKTCIFRVASSKHLLGRIRRYNTTSALAVVVPPEIRATNHVINGHAKGGNLDLAQQLFDQMLQRNLVSWTILISAYAQRGRLFQCFGLFSRMLHHEKPNDFAYASVLSVCDYSCGQQVHGLVLKTGYHAWIYVANALICMYWNNGNNSGIEALEVFHGIDSPNLVTCNTMISGFGMCQQGDKAMALFKRMCLHGILFDRTTMLSLVSSLCGVTEGINCLLCCCQLHCLSIKSGFSLDAGVATSLIKTYSSHGGDVEDCHKIFMETSPVNRDAVLWTGVMSACAEKKPEQALRHFNQMCREGLHMDSYVLLVAAKACSNLVTGRNASAIHCRAIAAGFMNVIDLQNALIHSYARCGSFRCAEKVFQEMSYRDVVSWNSMLKAHAIHGNSDAALHLFQQMDVEPDETTFVALLTSCSHAGLVKEGVKIFDSMYEKHGIVPRLDHYACMVDLFGRAGQLSEAEIIIQKMPMEPDYVVWSALLGACRKHGETKLAEFASSKLKELDPYKSPGYVLVSNVYCSTKSYCEGSIVRDGMIRIGVKKEAGLSWTEANNQVHEFASGGRQHLQLEAILKNMAEFVAELKKVGYMPVTDSVFFDVEDEQKEEQLLLHSEKLALVFSLMNSGDSTYPVRIVKNIRICSDCHNFMRLASMLVNRVIIVRDSNRFHHFEKGACSCNEYW